MLKFVFLLATIVLVESCVDLDECQRNMTIAIENYSNNFAKLLKDTTQVETEANDRFIKEVEKLQEEIANGPENCKKYKLSDEPIMYLEQIFENCPSDFPLPDKEAEDIISHFPSDYMENNTEEDRIYYCKHLVPVLKYYCDRLMDGVNTIQTCGLIETFNEIYRTPWENCKKSQS